MNSQAGPKAREAGVIIEFMAPTVKESKDRVLF
jgi:hypothetical protein